MCNECADDHGVATHCPRIVQLDQQICGLALARLRATGRFQDGEVRCEVRNGEVVLRGRVVTWYQKQMAQHAVLGIANVAAVRNHIEVGPPRSNNQTVGRRHTYAYPATQE